MVKERKNIKDVYILGKKFRMKLKFIIWPKYEEDNNG